MTDIVYDVFDNVLEDHVSELVSYELEQQLKKY